MILTTNKNSETITSGQLQTGEMSIDKSDEHMLMMIMSEGLYKDPIGSTIREWTSNALDSHTEAGVTDPVIVSITEERGFTFWFKVQDFGMGISPDRQKNVVSKYAASTKRQSEDLLGAFGLGLKSGLAYADSFIYTTRWEGTEYRYMMYKGEEKTNIDLISENPTTERNGTTFQIQIKNRADMNEFRTKCAEQLCYFENVYFEGCGIDNGFTIVKNEDWKYSSIQKDKLLHMSLDNVYYAIDYNRLGIDPIYNMPIALNFKIRDGLVPTPSREDIKYTPTAKALIIEKIKKVADYFANKFNESVKEVDELGKIMFMYGKYTYNIAPYMDIELSRLQKYTDIKLIEPKLKGYELLNVKDICTNKLPYIFGGWVVNNEVIGGSMRNYESSRSVSANNFIHSEGKEYIICKDKPKGVQLEYIKSTYRNVKFIYQSKALVLGNPYSWLTARDAYTYLYILELKGHDIKNWRPLIKEVQRLSASVMSKFKRLEDVTPDAEWLRIRKENRKKATRTTVSREEINPKMGETALKGSANVTFKPGSPRIIDFLYKEKYITVYGTIEQKNQLNHLAGLFCNNTNNRGEFNKVAILSDRDMERMEKRNIHNWIKFEKFMEGSTRTFKQYASAYKIKILMDSNHKIFSYTRQIACISTDFAAKLETLATYAKGYTNNNDYHDRKFWESVLKVAEEKDLFDEEIMVVYDEVSKNIGIFDFFNLLTMSKYSNLDGQEVAIRDLAVEILKGRKFKVNLKFYSNSNLNTVPAIPAPIEEEKEEEMDDDEPFEDGEEEMSEQDVEEVLSILEA